MSGFSGPRFGAPGGGAASFASLTGAPGDNAALAAALGAKLNLTGGTLTGALTVGNGTLTASAPVLDLTQTWNNVAVTFTGLRLNITDTASAATSNLLDIQVGGTSAAYIPKRATAGGTGGGIQFRSAGGAFIGVRFRDIAMQFLADTGGECGEVYPNGWRIGSRALEFGSATTSPDLFLRRRAAASLFLGTDSATPVSQTLGVSAGSGTNINGANFTIAAGAGTGSGTPGQLIFQTSQVGSTGSTAQTLTTRLTITNTIMQVGDGININTGTSLGTIICQGGTAKLGFWGATPVVQQDVAGSRADPEQALATLLGTLATIGIITDSTTT